jgi:hypothetical protein
MEIKKANNFFEIQDAVAFNIPVDDKHLFYTDFSNFRNDFKEKKIYKHLNINPRTNKCNPLQTPKKIFLSGYRGTGKTSELLKLTNSIDDTKCYFSIFVNISDEELDTNNIETVDVLILMVEKLVAKLEKKGASVDENIISSFYDWYASRIEEVNSNTKATGSIEAEAKASIGLLGLLTLLTKTKAQLQTSTETKEVIRQVFNNKFSDFSTKFNEFILSLKEKFNEKGHYQDILFILDGFEKIGSDEDRKKILINDSNKFTIINAHMITTLPIELFSEKNRLNHFSTTLYFPLIDLELKGATDKMREFILKRVDIGLFENNEILNKIIKYGAGHPRQTLQIISRAFVEAEEECIDSQAINKTISLLSREMSVIDDNEKMVLNQIKNKEEITSLDTYTGLKAKNIIFDYGMEENETVINPIILENKKLFASSTLQ